jgi:hypothetical protein
MQALEALGALVVVVMLDHQALPIQAAAVVAPTYPVQMVALVSSSSSTPIRSPFPTLAVD